MAANLNPTQKGILWALFGYSAFAVSDASVKWLTADYSFWQIITLDTGLAALLLLAFSPWLRGEDGVFRTGRLGVHALRALMNFLVSVFVVLSLAHLPLTAVYTVVFTKPFFAALLAMLIYGERAGIHRILAIAAGFTGILIAMRPGAQAVDPWLFMPLGVAISAALMFVVSRSLEKESVFALGFYPALGSCLLSLPFALDNFQMPDAAGWLVFILSGAGIAGGLIGVSLAFRMAPSSAVSPFHYVQMLWGLALGWLIFTDLPDLWMMAGAAIIIASGLYLITIEKRTGGP